MSQYTEEHTQMEHPFLYAPGLHSTMQPWGKQELEQVFAFARVAFWNTVQARMLHRFHSDFQFTAEIGAYRNVTPVISFMTVKILFKFKNEQICTTFLEKKTGDNFIKLTLRSLNETVYFVLCSLKLIIYFLMVFLKQVNWRTIVSANTCYNCGDEESDHNRSAA